MDVWLDIRDSIRAYIEVHNEGPAEPFRWTESAGVILKSVERAQAFNINELSR